MKPVTDPALIEQLEGSKKQVTDPALLSQLEAKNEENGVVQAVKNIPGSAGNFVSSLAQPILHPIDTFQGLRSAYRGAIQNVLPDGWVKPYEGSQQDIATANAVGGYYKDRFGGAENIKNTAISDPVGFASDAAAALSIAGVGLRAAGLNKAANAAQTASRSVDPLYLAAKATKSAVKPAYTWAAGTTSGAGSKAINEALKGGDAFTDAMRGNSTESEVLQSARDSLDEIRNARSAEYQTRLSGLQSATQKLDISDIKSSADDWLKRYNVTKTNTGDLDFSRSTVTGKGVDEVKNVYQMIQDWGSKAEDLTPANLDVLKRRIGSFYTEDNQSRAMVTALEKSVKNKIVSAVPEYAEMTKEYAKASEVIKSVEDALLGRRGASADTALRKLTTAIREDKTFRRSLLATLDKAGDKDVIGSLSGLMLKPAWSQRLGPMMTTLGVGGTASVMSNPWLLGLLPLASPRAVGEFSRALGAVSKKTAPYGRGAGITAYQVGRLPLKE